MRKCYVHDHDHRHHDQEDMHMYKLKCEDDSASQVFHAFTVSRNLYGVFDSASVERGAEVGGGMAWGTR